MIKQTYGMFKVLSVVDLPEESLKISLTLKLSLFFNNSLSKDDVILLTLSEEYAFLQKRPAQHILVNPL